MISLWNWISWWITNFFRTLHSSLNTLDLLRKNKYGKIFMTICSAIVASLFLLPWKASCFNHLKGYQSLKIWQNFIVSDMESLRYNGHMNNNLLIATIGDEKGCSQDRLCVICYNHREFCYKLQFYWTVALRCLESCQVSLKKFPSIL